MSEGSSLVPFAKPWQSCSDQLKTLEARGLVVRDRSSAEEFLSHVNYYRLSGYGLAFEQSRHVFVPGTTFEQLQAAARLWPVLPSPELACRC